MLANTYIFVLLCATCVVPIHGIPKITVDLDLPPRQRWREMARLYKRQLPHMMRAWGKEVRMALGDNGLLQAQSYLNLETSREHQEEIMGMVDELNHSQVTYELLRTWNSMYELNHPTFCTALLMAQRNGTVIHGRNMDYIFLFKMHGKMVQLSSVLFEAIFKRNGKPQYMGILWPGHIGFHTAMRYGGYSVNVNMRKNIWRDNLEAFKVGAGSHSLQMRNVIDQTANFEEAVKAMYALKLAAPMYIILAGTKPYEGVVLTLDRAGLHKKTTVQPLRLSTTMRHLVQTNDDLNGLPLDIRRPIIESFLSLSKFAPLDNNYVLRQMRIPPNFNSATIFTTIFNPAMGLTETFLPYEQATVGKTFELRTKNSPFNKLRGWQRFLAPAPTAPPHEGPPQNISRGWQRFLAPAPTAPPHEGPPEGVIADDKVRTIKILEP